MKPRSGAMQHIRRAVWNTMARPQQRRHPNLNTATDVLFQRPAELQQFSQDDVTATTNATPLLEVVRLFCSLAMLMLGLVPQLLDVSRAHTQCKVLRDNVYIERPKELGLDSTLLAPPEMLARNTRRRTSLRVRCPRRLRSEQHLTRSVIAVRPPTQDTTVVVLGARRRLRGTGSRSAP